MNKKTKVVKGVDHAIEDISVFPQTSEMEEFDNTFGTLMCPGIMNGVIKSFISKNYVAKSELRKLLENGHGGGNWRRLISSLLEE